MPFHFFIIFGSLYRGGQSERFSYKERHQDFYGFFCLGRYLHVLKPDPLLQRKGRVWWTVYTSHLRTALHSVVQSIMLQYYDILTFDWLTVISPFCVCLLLLYISGSCNWLFSKNLTVQSGLNIVSTALVASIRQHNTSTLAHGHITRFQLQ